MDNDATVIRIVNPPGRDAGSSHVHRLRRLGFKFLALLLGLFAAALLAELAVRVFAPQPMSFGRFYAPDEMLNWTLQPNHHEQITTGEYSMQVHVDPLGCRAIGAPRRVTSHTTVLVLGDSFMFGNGVQNDEVMAARLQAILGDITSPARHWNVVNASVPGYGPIQYRLRYLHFRNKLRPFVAIVGLYVGNDILDCVWDKSGVTVVHGYLVSKEASNASALRFWVKRKSHLYRFASRISQRLRQAHGPRKRSYPDTLATLFAKRSWDDDTPESRVWTSFEAAFEKLLQSLRADGVTPLVVILPMQLQVDDALWADYVNGTVGKNGQPQRYYPQKRIGDFLARSDVAFLDLTDACLTEGGSDLFYALDGHWNPKGHALAARIVAERLSQMLADGSK